MVKQIGKNVHPNHHLAVQTLSHLQQVSLVLPNDGFDVLPSLIVNRRNLEWLKALEGGLDYPVPKWTLSSIMSVVYVALADLFTWIDTLSGPLSNVVVNATGESISSLWLCFLPIVIGNLQLSPKTDLDRIQRAFKLATPHPFVATDESSPEQARSDPISINLEFKDTIYDDEISSAPVYFYARAFTWISAVRKVAEGLDEGGNPPSSAPDHRDDQPNTVHETRTTTDQETHTTHQATARRTHQETHDSFDTFKIFATSALLAIFLQWGTTGAAIMAMFLTPTKGRLT